MKPLVNCLVTLFAVAGLANARAEERAGPGRLAPSSWQAARLYTIPADTQLHEKSGASDALRAAPQGQLARGIEAAHVGARPRLAEDVTTAQDGTDKVYRITTSRGTNMCLNWRDVNRFDPGRGKAVFVVACNR
jgi:hypothetical protein